MVFRQAAILRCYIAKYVCVELWDHLKMVYHVSYTSVYGIKQPGMNLQKTRYVVVHLVL